MSIRERLQILIIGRSPFSGTLSDFKSAILCGQLAIALFFVGTLYIIIDLSNDFSALVPYYGITLLIAIVVLTLLRLQYYREAKSLLIVGGLIVTYIFTSNDTYRAGVYIYFIVTNIMSLALFGYKDRAIAFGAAFLSIIFFYLSYVLEFKIVMLSEEDMVKIYQEDYVRISFISNFIIGSLVCVLIVYFLLDVNDQSERKILNQNNELTKTNQELDRFVYSASHDLRAPLSSMLGLIDVAQRSATQEERDKCLEMMKGRVHNMEEFISEIIDYSRNARTDVAKEKTLLLDLVKSVVEELHFMEGIQKLTVTYEIDPALMILTDPLRLKVILNNVIGNALKYRDTSKSMQKIELKAQKKNNSIIITVKDNGVGIPAEHHNRIFDMFYRASESSQGSGLGLYIVKETIERLNGKVSLASATGEGTTFFIELPA